MIAHPGKSHFEVCSRALTRTCLCLFVLLRTSTHPFWVSLSLPWAVAAQQCQVYHRLTLTRWPPPYWVRCWSICRTVNSPRTASTGWGRVLLDCQTRTRASVCHSSAGTLWTSVVQTRPHRGREKPCGRQAGILNNPFSSQAQLRGPGSKRVNTVNVLATSKMRFLLIVSALWRGQAKQSKDREIIESRELQKLEKKDKVYRGAEALRGQVKVDEGSWGHEGGTLIFTESGEICCVSLSVFSTHIIIKHKPIYLEHKTTTSEQQRTHVPHVRKCTKTGRGKRTRYPDHGNVDLFMFGFGCGLKYHKTWRERAKETLGNALCWRQKGNIRKKQNKDMRLQHR